MYCKTHGTTGVVKTWVNNYQTSKEDLLIKCVKCHQKDLKQDQKKRELRSWINDFELKNKKESA